MATTRHAPLTPTCQSQKYKCLGVSAQAYEWRVEDPP